MPRLLLLFTCLALIGCDAPIDRFDPNSVYALTLARSHAVPTDMALADVSDVVDELFGTPNQPHWPSAWIDGSPIVDSLQLQRAAGDFSSLQDDTHLGLFREHCVACHGLAGNGSGPASLFQDPYPRDFRRGVFKWKSTLRNAKPTRADLLAVIEKGLAGTSMPSFAAVAEPDKQVLVDYVIYLSVRGEFERNLLAAVIDEMDYESENRERLTLSTSQSEKLIRDVLNPIVDSWRSAAEQIIDVPSATLQGDNAAADRGRDLFHGQLAKCASCHGPSGNGKSLTLDFDDWTKEYSTGIGITPTDRDKLKPFRDAGAHRPRQIAPRRLNEGTLRGGSDGATLYRRIVAGIAGTPMPGIDVTEDESTTGLASAQVWELVRYVQSLSHSEETP